MNLKAIIETLLFAHGAPLSVEKIAKATGRKKEEVRQALDELKREYQNRGIVILEKDDEAAFGSNPEFSPYIEDFAKSEFNEELSRAAAETLAIIAYKGPLTRVEIEYIRGVNCSFILRSILMRGLVERIENPKDARSYLYRISFDFLKHFGLTKAEDLPHFEEFRKEPVEIPEEANVRTSVQG